MPKKAKLAELRRLPSQSRALDTVETLLTAAKAVLVERGYAKTTTLHIADKAGISVGSLYQYFGNKEGVVQALLKRHVEKSQQLLLSGLDQAAHQPFETVVRTTVRSMVAFHCENYGICDVLYNELPRDGDFRILAEHFAQLTRTIEIFLQAHKEKVRPQNLKLAANMIVHGITGIYFGVDPAFKESSHEELTREIEEMVLLYLLSGKRVQSGGSPWSSF
ncbi:MAG TPA: TetR/AcrR family transcriptional regulator [Bdellovibrionota bacterium]|jgi:AcrR family transcriptional regulator